MLAYIDNLIESMEDQAFSYFIYDPSQCLIRKAESPHPLTYLAHVMGRIADGDEIRYFLIPPFLNPF